jgi:hypothetical protein
MKQQKSNSSKTPKGLASPRRSQIGGIVGRKSAYAESELKPRGSRTIPRNRLVEQEGEDAGSKNSGSNSRKSYRDSRKSDLSAKTPGSDSRKSCRNSPKSEPCGFSRMSHRVSSKHGLNKDSLKLGMGINVLDADATERNLLT